MLASIFLMGIYFLTLKNFIIMKKLKLMLFAFTLLCFVVSTYSNNIQAQTQEPEPEVEYWSDGDDDCCGGDWACAVVTPPKKKPIV